MFTPKRLFTLVLLCAACITGWAQRQIAAPPLRTPGSLHPLPLAYTGMVPQVFLPGDSVRQPHIRTHMVEYVSAGRVDNNHMIEGLKAMGLQQGVDAVVLKDYTQLIPGFETVTGALTGIGIKYLDNLQYIDTILRQKVIFSYEPNGKADKTYLVDFDWYGRLTTPVTNPDVQFYAQQMSAYDLALLMHRQSVFYEYRHMGLAYPVKITSATWWPARIQHMAESTLFEMMHLKTMATTWEGGKRTRTAVTPVHKDNLLVGAIVTTPGSRATPLLYLHYKYDARGRLVEERWEKLINGKRTLWLQVENRFYEASAVAGVALRFAG